jgi:hypothetical protein
MHPTAYGEREAPSVDLTLELRKDLLRLRQAESEGERAAILNQSFRDWDTRKKAEPRNYTKQHKTKDLLLVCFA